jgi:transcriptional regulator with XRE-family HTH domain
VSGPRGAKSVGPVGLAAAANVRLLRKARGLSMDQLVEQLRAAGRPWWSSTLTRIEGGQRHLDCDDLAGLAAALDVTVQRLLEPVPPCPDCLGAPPVGFACLACGTEAQR